MILVKAGFPLQVFPGQAFVTPGLALPQSLVASPSFYTINTANLTVNLAGTNTLWNSGTVFSVSGVSGVSITSQSVISATSATITLAIGANPGTATISDGANSTTFAIQAMTASPAIIPTNTSGFIVNLAGVNTTWTPGYPGTPTFILAGIQGATITGQFIVSPTSAVVILNSGIFLGNFTITDGLNLAPLSVSSTSPCGMMFADVPAIPPTCLTPNSSIIPYILPCDVIARKDWRDIAMLVNDDPGTSVAPNNITKQNLLTNVNFLTIINSACGKLESACLRSKIYQPGDLLSLDGVSLEYMKTILSNIVIYELYSRRTGPAPSELVVNNYNDAMKALDDLSDGTRIFSFVQTEDAGLPTTNRLTPYDFYYNQNLISAKWDRSFGVRNDIRRLW